METADALLLGTVDVAGAVKPKVASAKAAMKRDGR